MGKRARTALRKREIQGIHSGGEMGYQGANIWPIFLVRIGLLVFYACDRALPACRRG